MMRRLELGCRCASLALVLLAALMWWQSGLRFAQVACVSDAGLASLAIANGKACLSRTVWLGGPSAPDVADHLRRMQRELGGAWTFVWPDPRAVAVAPGDRVWWLACKPLSDAGGWWIGEFSYTAKAYSFYNVRHTAIYFPAWGLPIAALLLHAVTWLPCWLRRLWRRRHRICVRCGYDLRATPQRCPECGLAVRRARPRVAV